MADAPFDPDAYLASPAAGPVTPAAPFNPDAYLRSGPPPANEGWYDWTVRQLEGANRAGDAFNSGFVRGIPVVGPWIEKGMQGAAALPSAVIPGMSIADSYNKLQADTAAAREEHPIAAGTGGVSGALMSAVPIGRAFPTLVGGNSLPGQMGASAVLGGTDAVSRAAADNGAITPSDVLWGAGIGGAAPVIGSVLAPVAQGGAWVGRQIAKAPGVRDVFKQAVPAEAQAIHDAADAGYRQLNTLYRYDPASLDDLSNLIKSDLLQGGTGVTSKGLSSPASAQQGAQIAHRELDTLSTLPPTPGSLHTVRKALNREASATNNSDEANSARYAAKKIDEFLEKPPQNAIVWQNPANPANANAGAILQDANANWQAWRQWRDIAGDNPLKPSLQNKAALEAAGYPTAALVEGQIIKRMTKDYLNNPNRSGFATPAQREALGEAATYGSMGHGLLDALGRTSQTQRLGMGWWLPYMAGGGFAAGLPGLAFPAAGAAANLASSQLTKQALSRAEQAIRATAPESQRIIGQQLGAVPGTTNPVLAQPVNPVQYPSLNPFQYRNEITRQLMLQAEQQRQNAMGGP